MHFRSCRGLGRAVAIIAQAAARRGLSGERQQAEELAERLFAAADRGLDAERRDLDQALALSSSVLAKRRFIVDGSHAGILFGDVGYEELDDPALAAQKLFQLLELASDTGAGFSIEFGMSTLAEMTRLLPGFGPRLAKAVGPGKRLEVVNGTYSQPYPLTIGWESNLRQFEVGLRACESLVDLRPWIYAAQEFGHHPQMPQILTGFGFRAATLRVRLCGEVPKCGLPLIQWAADDGTTIRCLTTLESVPTGDECGGLFYDGVGRAFGALMSAEAGYGVFNNLEDVVYPVDGREDVLRCPERDRILGEFCTYSEVFDRLGSEPALEVRFPAAGFRVRRFAVADLFHAVKEAEARLVTAEALEAFAAVLGLDLGLKEGLNQAWRSLLLAENHDSFAVPDHTPGTYTVERTAVFGQYRGIRSGVTLENKGISLASEATASAQAAIERLKWAVGGVIAGSVSKWAHAGKDDIMGNSLVILEVAGLGGLAVAEGRLHFPKGECERFAVRGIENQVLAQTVSETRWPDGSLKEAQIIIQAELPRLGYVVARVETWPAAACPDEALTDAADETEAGSETRLAAASDSRDGSLACLEERGRVRIDSGRIRVRISPDGQAVISTGADGANALTIQGTSRGEVVVMADGPVMARVRVREPEGEAYTDFTVRKDEGFVEIAQTREHSVGYSLRPENGISKVLADYPYGIGEVVPGTFHALSIAVIEPGGRSGSGKNPSAEDRFYVAHQGEPYFEFLPEEGMASYQALGGSSVLRVGVLGASDEPLVAARRMMLPPVLVQPPDLTQPPLPDQVAPDREFELRGSAGQIVRLRGDCLVSALRVVADELELRLFNPGQAPRPAELFDLPGYSRWERRRLDGAATGEAFLSPEAFFDMPPGRIQTLRAKKLPVLGEEG